MLTFNQALQRAARWGAAHADTSHGPMAVDNYQDPARRGVFLAALGYPTTDPDEAEAIDVAYFKAFVAAGGKTFRLYETPDSGRIEPWEV